MSLLIRGRILSVQSKKTAGFINRNFVHTRQMHRILGERKNLMLRTNLPSRRFSNEYPEVKLPPILGSPISSKILFRLTIGEMLPIFTRTSTLLTDQNITTEEFLEATKNAQCVVSAALANEDFEALDGLVTKRAIEILKPKIAQLNPHQKRLLNIKEENIVLHHIVGGSKYDDSEDSHVEIETASTYLPEFISTKVAMDEGPPFSEHGYICHYIFRRSENTEPWIIRSINHSFFVDNFRALWGMI